jgi:hypothetical protein
MNQYRYSATTGGFYVLGLHATVPDDAVPVTEEEHAALLRQQSAGQQIRGGQRGHPEAAEPEPLSAEERAALARDRRNRLLRESDSWMLPDRPMSANERDAWVRYRENLRRLPDQPAFPFEVIWPSEPRALPAGPGKRYAGSSP